MTIRERITGVFSSQVHLGVGTLIGFLRLLLLAIGSFIEAFPQASPSPSTDKSLEVRIFNQTNIDTLLEQAEVSMEPPSHKFVMAYLLVNTGSKAIMVSDW